MRNGELTMATRLTGLAMSRYCDWNTGANCRPSMSTVAELTAQHRQNVSPQVARLVDAGYLMPTGWTRSHNRIYQLTLPVSATADSDDRGTVSAAADSDADSDDSSVSAAAAVSVCGGRRTLSAAADTTSSYLSDRKGREEEDDEQRRPGAPADAGAAARADEEQATPAQPPDSGQEWVHPRPREDLAAVDAEARSVARTIRTELAKKGRVWTGAQVPTDTLRGLLRNHWPEVFLVEHALRVGKPMASADGLLAKHMAQLLAMPPWEFDSQMPPSVAHGLIGDQADGVAEVAARAGLTVDELSSGWSVPRDDCLSDWDRAPQRVRTDVLEELDRVAVDDGARPMALRGREDMWTCAWCIRDRTWFDLFGWPCCVGCSGASAGPKSLNPPPF